MVQSGSSSSLEVWMKGNQIKELCFSAVEWDLSDIVQTWIVFYVPCLFWLTAELA